ncbi:gastric triacylglycerol lipase [Galendromus occidentalis]|uniref:Gastric triacylglycerol lipase n=1 Tax=Galendromus occidentalis TaxID=34638 RepID=A0AAJ6QTE4_9ACAR|nr:gastric triacylglycerol lipase [Galendromus occidentalis]
MASERNVKGYILVLAVTVCSVSAFRLDQELDLLNRTNLGYAALHGMTLESVDAVTADGWVLQLHRVRNMKTFKKSLSAPVLLSHGCACSSVDFMVNPRNESLAFMLADRGYDVWAINYRANKFSDKMIKGGRATKPNATDFYRATWQYMAEYDFPAALDKVLQVTGQKKVYLIGQSMGATTLFAALSENKKYDDKILLYAALVPVIRFGNDTAESLKASFSLAPTIPSLAGPETFESLFGRQLFDLSIPGVEALKEFIQSTVCSKVPEFCELMSSLMEALMGGNANPHINQTREALYNIHNPAGVTAMNLYQFARQFGKSVWEKMDYDEVAQTGKTNMQEYGKTKPPRYNFSDVTVPVQYYFTKNDKYFGVATAQSLIKDLGIKDSDYKMIDGNGLEHHDTVWGWDARCYVYDHLLDRLDALESSRSLIRKVFRQRMSRSAKSLPFEDGCPTKPKSRA